MSQTVHKTSIVPKGGVMEPLRPTKSAMSSLGIEVIHIAVFLLVLVFLFGGILKSVKSKA